MLNCSPSQFSPFLFKVSSRLHGARPNAPLESRHFFSFFLLLGFLLQVLYLYSQFSWCRSLYGAEHIQIVTDYLLVMTIMRTNTDNTDTKAKPHFRKAPDNKRLYNAAANSAHTHTLHQRYNIIVK